MSTISFVGNLTKDPELAFGKTSGKAYARLRVAENRREKDAAGNWVDGAPIYRTVLVWGAQAENVTESLREGASVIVVGSERARKYTPEGTNESVTVIEVHADIVAPTLLWGTTTFTKVQRSATGSDVPEYTEADIPPAE